MGWAALTGLLLLLAGCNGEALQGYFPLDEGLQWHYRVTRSDPLGGHETSPLVLTNLGATTLDREPVFERRSSVGSHYYIDVRPEGYYRVAKRRVVDRRPRPDNPARMILPLPPRVGAHWRQTTATYLLKRVFPFHKTYQHRAAITMDFEVAATGLDVTVPAGSYHDCVRVEGEARIQIASDPRRGIAGVPLTQSEWYCPGVGLVRLTRQEKLYSDQAAIIGGRLEMVLTELDSGYPWARLWRRATGWL